MIFFRILLQIIFLFLPEVDHGGFKKIQMLLRRFDLFKKFHEFLFNLFFRNRTMTHLTIAVVALVVSIEASIAPRSTTSHVACAGAALESLFQWEEWVKALAWLLLDLIAFTNSDNAIHFVLSDHGRV
ncbi:MAG TPA: hypothetical protein VJB64_01755 [Patescibacteria group bacterium]|nr:hypothetical protein [Patescibacteria group bacterium]